MISEDVSTTCGSGWVGYTNPNHWQYRRLIIDPPATAGGTDMKFSRNQILGGLLLLALIWAVILLRAL